MDAKSRSSTFSIFTGSGGAAASNTVGSGSGAGAGHASAGVHSGVVSNSVSSLSSTPLPSQSIVASAVPQLMAAGNLGVAGHAVNNINTNTAVSPPLSHNNTTTNNNNINNLNNTNNRKGTPDGVTINSLCNIMGAGTLALPFAFHNASLIPSMALLLWLGALSYHAAHALTLGCDAVGRYSYTECVVLNMMPLTTAEKSAAAGKGGDPLVSNRWRRLLTIAIESVIVLSGFGTLVVYSRVIGDAVPTVFASVGLGGLFEDVSMTLPPQPERLQQQQGFNNIGDDGLVIESDRGSSYRSAEFKANESGLVDKSGVDSEQGTSLGGAARLSLLKDAADLTGGNNEGFSDVDTPKRSSAAPNIVFEVEYVAAGSAAGVSPIRQAGGSGCSEETEVGVRNPRDVEQPEYVEGIDGDSSSTVVSASQEVEASPPPHHKHKSLKMKPASSDLSASSSSTSSASVLYGLADLVLSWVIPAIIFFFLSCAQTMEKLKWASIIGFGTIFYIVVIVIGYYIKDAVFVHHRIAIGEGIRWFDLDVGGAFGAVSTFAIAYRYHFNVPYFYGELKQRVPSVMMKTTDFSMTVVVLCYALTGLCGYLMYGALVEGEHTGEDGSNGGGGGSSLAPTTGSSTFLPAAAAAVANANSGRGTVHHHGHAGGNIIDNFDTNDFLANVGRFGLLIHFAMSYPIISVCTRRGMHRLYVLIWQKGTGSDSNGGVGGAGAAGGGDDEEGAAVAAAAAPLAPVDTAVGGGVVVSTNDTFICKIGNAAAASVGNAADEGPSSASSLPSSGAQSVSPSQTAPSQKAVMVEAAILVCVTSSIAHSIHGIGAVMEFFGALFGVPTVLILPGIVGLQVFHPRNAQKKWLAHLASSPSSSSGGSSSLAFAFAPFISVPSFVVSGLPRSIRENRQLFVSLGGGGCGCGVAGGGGASQAPNASATGRFINRERCNNNNNTNNKGGGVSYQTNVAPFSSSPSSFSSTEGGANVLGAAGLSPSGGGGGNTKPKSAYGEKIAEQSCNTNGYYVTNNNNSDNNTNDDGSDVPLTSSFSSSSPLPQCPHHTSGPSSSPTAALAEIRQKIAFLRVASWVLVVFGFISFTMGLVTSHRGHGK